VPAKFSLPHNPGPESLTCEGPYYVREVLSVSYVDAPHRRPVPTYERTALWTIGENSGPL
jgi:hypothetical protein